MKEQRIHLLRTALLWVLLELIAAAQVSAPGGGSILWVWARTAVAPLVWTGETIGSLVSNVVTGISDSTRLVAENRRLQLELESARTRVRVMEEDQAASRELETLISRLPTLAENAIPGRISYRDLIRGRMIALIAVDHRIPPDTPVVASGGVIGRVIRSEGRRCWIELITHPVAAIAVQSESGEIQGLAVGGDSGELDIQFVSRQARLLRGDLLVTSGADGIYPPGLPVGLVGSVRESAGAFLEVRALPATDLATTRVVLLLDGWVTRPADDGVPR